jgi:hypothetical protein
LDFIAEKISIFSIFAKIFENNGISLVIDSVVGDSAKLFLNYCKMQSCLGQCWNSIHAVRDIAEVIIIGRDSAY